MSSSVGTQTLHHSPDFIIGTDHQSRQIRSDSIPEFQIHRDGIPHSNQHSQNSTRQNSVFTSDYQTVFSKKKNQKKKNGFCQTIPFSFWKTRCSSRLCSTREIMSQTITNVCTSTMETLCSPSSLPNSDVSQHQTSPAFVEQSSDLSRRCS